MNGIARDSNPTNDAATHRDGAAADATTSPGGQPGDRPVALWLLACDTRIGERGPFHALLREFQRHFERIDAIGPRPARPPTELEPFDGVHMHPAPCGRLGMVRYIREKGRELIEAHVRALLELVQRLRWDDEAAAERLSENAGEDPKASVRLKNLRLLLEHRSDNPLARSAAERAVADRDERVRRLAQQHLA